MPQKGLKKDDGVRGRREELSSKVFPFFPDHKSTFIGNRAYFFCQRGLLQDIPQQPFVFSYSFTHIT